MSKVVVSGTGGFIGHYLAAYLSEKGHEVTGLYHHTKPDFGSLPVHTIAFDLSSEIPGYLFQNADYFIHCAYIPFRKGMDTDKLNKESTSRIKELCTLNSVRLVYFSTISAHENSVSHYGKNKWECERLLDPSADLILKPGLVLGEKGLFHSISGWIQKSPVVPVIGGNYPVQLIGINELAVVINQSIAGSWLPGKFKTAHTEKVSLRELYEHIAHLSGKKTIFIPFPLWLALALARLTETLGLKLTVTSESVLGIKQLIPHDTSADIQSLGLKPETVINSLRALY